MKMINIAIVAVVLGFGIPAASAETDTFQQVINYLYTGDPYEPALEKIIDRENCVTTGEYFFDVTNVYWNNVVPDTILVGRQFDSGYSEWRNVITISGPKPVAVTWTPGIQNSHQSYTSWSISSPAANVERIGRALSLLYSDHCKGSISAF